MKSIVKKTAAIMLGALISTQIRVPVQPYVLASATTPEPSAQLVIFEIVPTPTPEPVSKPVEVIEYQNQFSEIEILARLLWSSPLRDEQQKKNLLWVVFNRISDQSNSFGFDVESVVTQNEFSFYDRHSHLSDENLRIADETMNEWKSERDGHYVGPHVPARGLYIRFIGEHNRAIEITAEPGGEALVW